MICQDCQRASLSAQYKTFNPACIHCGARIIQFLGRQQIAASLCSERRTKELKVWTDLGHSEVEIRRLAKGPWSIGQDETTESVAPTRKKRR